MSITRAFTTRRVKQSLELRDAARDAAEGVVARSHTTSKAHGSISSIRNKISAPVELISTTNMLSYNAPDIYPKTASSTSAQSRKSEEDSDSTPSLASAGSTPPTSPDSPFPAKRSVSPEPNHLSCYFTPPGQPLNAPTSTEAPAIPQRAPSHTKKSYDTLTRHRSASRMSEQSGRSVSTKGSFSFSRSSSTSTHTTATSHSSVSFSAPKVPPPPPVLPPITSTPLPAPPSHRKESSMISHPFGPELAQVSELAEEYNPRGAAGLLVQEEEQELLHKGFKKFSPDSYLKDIQSLYASFFAEEKPVRPMWI